MNGFPAFHSFCIVVFQFSIVMIIIVFIELVLGIVAAVAVNKVNGDNGVVSFNITKDLMHDAYEAFYGSATDTKERQATRIVWNLAQKQGVSQALFIHFSKCVIGYFGTFDICFYHHDESKHSKLLTVLYSDI
mgnify:FL=1